MNEHPIRKKLRLKNYDYSRSGMYFVTVCIKDRLPLLWENHTIAKETNNISLSHTGAIVNTAIEQISSIYPSVTVAKYCIMPDHIHLIIQMQSDDSGRQIAAPTLSTIIGQMKRWVSKQSGQSIWQKSFIDRIIRNEKEFLAIWQYIENNPKKLDTAYENIYPENT